MIKVAFCCPWGTDPKSLLSALKRETPNNDGVWNNIIGVGNVYDADWIVAIEDLDRRIDLARVNEEKIILCGREPPWIGRINWDKHKTIHKFKHSIGNSYLFGGWSFPLTHAEVSHLQRTERKKKICTITSNKRMCSGHVDRMSFVKKFCQKYPGIMDVYGKGMEKEGLGEDYKGTSVFGDKQKLDWLQEYDYALCIENGQLNGYFSEKFNDSIIAHTMPLYFGAPDIDKYYPEGSFHIIDIKSQDACEKIIETISNPITEDQQRKIVQARNNILNKYNWWASIERIINTGKVLE